MKAYLEIEMPRCCNKCPMLVYEGHTLCICRALPAIEEGEVLKPWKNKRKDCPLKPIPPHGDLIDRDYVKEHLYACETNGRPLHKLELCELLDAINDIPTIIPTEEGET